ncbi:MAG TPA: Calx-beta domain-containing protein [Vicinamibacterales bacterium]|nr:Calx-beta domain-containing protein [Vicinamibacterales bacterium]
MRIRLICTCGIAAAAILAAACGDSKPSLNPTAPSALSAESISAGAADGTSASMHHRPGHGGGPGNGNGHGNGNGNGNNDPRTPTNTSPGPTAPVPPGKSKVEFEGLIQAVSSGSILVNGQVIMVTTDTIIRHGNRTFTLAELNEGDRVHVRAARVAAPVGAAVATLVAELILLQNPDDDGAGGEIDCLVSLVASDPTATETPLTTGTFTLTRSGTAAQLALPLTVSYTVSGTATSGDYTIPGTTTFAANQTTATVLVTPVPDALAEGTESLVLTLTSAGVAPCEAGSPSTATVGISDTAVPIVTVDATDANATEAPGDTGTFTLTRTGDTAAALVVTVTFTGTATGGIDYTALPTTVTFAPGSATATVEVSPLADAPGDPSETVMLTVVDTPTYDLGTPSSAAITITGT